jgi:hypothetical protein
VGAPVDSSVGCRPADGLPTSPSLNIWIDEDPEQFLDTIASDRRAMGGSRTSKTRRPAGRRNRRPLAATLRHSGDLECGCFAKCSRQLLLHRHVSAMNVNAMHLKDRRGDVEPHGATDATGLREALRQTAEE